MTSDLYVAPMKALAAEITEKLENASPGLEYESVS